VSVAVIGFVPHPTRSEAIGYAESAAAWLVEAGHQVRIASADGAGKWGWPPDKLADGLDLAVSLGGDGTMLRAVDMVAAAEVPVLGVNVGHLGYLTVVGPDELNDALSRFLAGDYQIEKRMTLVVTVTTKATDDGPTAFNALNDAVLQRGAEGHTVRLAMTVAGEQFLTYAADSMIVATPTGSTAYNLSARGPIVSPRARVLVITPVAAHMLFDRSLILDADEQITLEVIDGRQAELVVDGRSVGVLSTGDVFACGAGPHDARLVSFGRRQFHHLLKQKFGLSDR
jgi:NAD+ kinase